MPRFSAPFVSLASLAVICLIATGCGGGSAAAPSAATSAAARPTMELKLGSGPGVGTYAIDQASSLNLCTKGKDGSWRLLYAGGKPFVNLDLLVGPHAGQSDGANAVAAEIEANRGYLRFDPAILRGGDPKGRSTATIGVSSTPATTTFTIHATTPDRTGGSDGAPVDVDLTVTCPNPA
jgi:hypothetical protein